MYCFVCVWREIAIHTLQLEIDMESGTIHKRTITHRRARCCSESFAHDCIRTPQWSAKFEVNDSSSQASKWRKCAKSKGRFKNNIISGPLPLSHRLWDMLSRTPKQLQSELLRGWSIHTFQFGGLTDVVLILCSASPPSRASHESCVTPLQQPRNKTRMFRTQITP